jgi:hypothetical protein
MSAATTMVTGPERGEAGGIGLHGWATIAWTSAGGIALGGMLIGLMTLSGRMSGFGLFMTSSGLFLAGALIGLVHALVLGYLGRPEHVSKRRALRDLGMGAVYSSVALPFAWVVAMWIALSMPAAYLGRVLALAGVAVGWLAGAALLAAAAVAGWRLLRNAYARWPERRLGTLLTAATFAALLVLFLAERPEIWGLSVRVTETGAVLLAAFATLWLVGPIITLALHLLAGMPGRHPEPAMEPARRVVYDVALGMLVGLVLGLVAAPFAVPAALPAGATDAPLGAVAISLGQALVDEVLLRLGLVTGVMYLALRWRKLAATEAMLVSVAVAAAVQLALYTPGVLALGFPTAPRAIGFTLALVVVPALVFGALYWRRGLGAAIAADATALAVIGFIAL